MKADAPSHFTACDSFSSALVGFCHLCRSNGLQPGILESIESHQLVLKELWHDKHEFRFALIALMCKAPEDRDRFVVLFDRFWGQGGNRYRSKTTYKNQSNIRKKSRGTVVMMGQGQSKKSDKESAKTTTGAHAQESLKFTDFSLVDAMDSEALNRLAERLLREMSLRLKRRQKRGKKGKLDLSKLLRKNTSFGGDILRLQYKHRHREKYRLIVLLDVSGSMDKYSFYLLRFMWSLRSHFKHVEAFVFSTRLQRITDHLDSTNLEESLDKIGHSVRHWSGGTQIGNCLQHFNEKYAKRVLNGKSFTVILSDGLDTGSPDVLGSALQKIRLRTTKVIWLNPLKAMPGYQPVQKGMSAALAHLDQFSTGHNLASLLNLEDILAHA